MSQHRPQMILVVDDNPIDLAMVAQPLWEAGYHVVTASDGDQALQAAQSELPDCIVLDVVLPQQSGFQVCRKLRQNPATQHIPIIMLSIKKTEVDQLWGMQQGATLYLTKPFPPDQLRQIVQGLLR